MNTIEIRSNKESYKNDTQMRQKIKINKIEKNNVNSKFELRWNSYALYYRLGMYIQYTLSHVTIIEKCH
jgi:hypothetical protein